MCDNRELWPSSGSILETARHRAESTRKPAMEALSGIFSRRLSLAIVLVDGFAQSVLWLDANVGGRVLSLGGEIETIVIGCNTLAGGSMRRGVRPT